MYLATEILVDNFVLVVMSILLCLKYKAILFRYIFERVFAQVGELVNENWASHSLTYLQV